MAANPLSQWLKPKQRFNFAGRLDDVTTHQGQEITYSYRYTLDGCVDAYIVE